MSCRLRARVRSRPVAALVVGLAVIVALLAGTARPVWAHAELESSTPAANSVLEDGPHEIVLDFDEAIEADLTSIALYDLDGRSIATGQARAGADDTIVHASLPQLDDGVFAVVWRITSADGHVIDGAFSFQVGTSTAGDGQELIDRVREGVRAGPAVRWTYSVARFLLVIGAIALIGAGWWTLQGAPERSARPRLRRLAVVAWTILLVGSAASFGLFGAQAVAGTVADAFQPSVWGDLATTEAGRMLLLRTTLAIVFGALLVFRRQIAQGWWRGAAIAAAVLTLYSFSAAGHANAQDPAAFWIAVDLAHLGAIAVWLGGLLALVVIGREALAIADGEQLARRFSFAAAIAVPVVVATGVAQTLRLSGGIDDLTSTDWGRLLLAKVTIVVALLSVAAVSRWLLLHDGVASIRRTVIVEAVMGVFVVGLAAGMVALPPEAPVAARAFSEQLSVNGLIAEVSISPGRVGTNEVHVVITPPGGSIIPVVAATARVSLLSAEIPASPVALVKDGPDHFSGTVTFPRSGDWEFELVVQVTETESVLLKTTVSIP